MTLPALPCLVLKNEGKELVVEREGRLVASLDIYQLCQPNVSTAQGRDKQVQAGTNREIERTSRGNSDKQDTIVSTQFICPATQVFLKGFF